MVGFDVSPYDVRRRVRLTSRYIGQCVGVRHMVAPKAGTDISDKAIELGWRDGDAQEVTSGLAEGEEVGILLKPKKKKRGRRRP